MAMETTPYWIDTAPLPEFPKLAADLAVDVVVIGGGLTGISAAYLLKKAGATVALLERKHFAALDTGHTTAHLTYVTDLRLSELVRTFGRDHAQAAWDAGCAAMTQIQENLHAEQIDAEFSWVPGYLHAYRGAPEPEEGAKLREDSRLAQEMGFEAALMAKVPFMARPGIRFANQAKFHPRKYLAGLLPCIHGEGSYAFEQTAVEEVQAEPLAVKANGRTIQCRYLVIATHVPLQGLAGTLSAALFQTKLAPYSTYAVGARLPRGLVPEASFWDTNDPYDYLRIDRHETHDYAILGGGDHKTGQAKDPAQHFAELEKRLLKLIPQAEVEHRWSGQVIETHDGLPFIGEVVPKQFIATGFSGNGMTFGTVAAMMARDAFLGRKNPWQELFDPSRKSLVGGAWDYLKENKDYPYYMLKQSLSKAASTPLAKLKAGEGKVIQLGGEKVAAYRDTEGQLTVKSAVCPHMGCIVRWNAAETTWDCPCHGSRFHARGEVMAGPAETGLAEAEAK